MTRIFFGIIILLCAVVAVEAQDSLNMSCVSRLDYWQEADDIQIVGNLAYIVCSASGLHIVDMSNAVNPVEIGKYVWCNDGFDYCGVYVSGNLAYLALESRLVVLDVSDPRHPVALNEPFPCLMIDILVHDNIGIGVDGLGGVPWVVDVSNPDSIFYMSVESSFYERSTCLVGMVGDYFCLTHYTGNGSRLCLYGLDSLRQLQLISEIDSPNIGYRGMIYGNYAYLASRWGATGVSIVDMSNPLVPIIVGTCDCGSCTDIAVFEGRAVIARGDNRMDVWNVNNPTNTFSEGMYASDHTFYSVKLAGSMAYLGGAGLDKAVTVVDISEPSSPVQICSFGKIGNPSAMTTGDGLAYLADSRIGLRIVDLSNPAHVSELGRTQEYNTNCSDIAVQENRVYLASTHGVSVYDISNPAEPDSLLRFGLMSKHQGVVLNGDYLYTFRSNESVVCGYLLTYDLHDPAVPLCVDSVWIQEHPMSFVRSNDLLFCSFWPDGFCIYDLADPASPQLAGTYPVSWTERFSDLVVDGRFVYLAVENEGIRILDISNPANPVQVGRLQEQAKLIAVRGDTMVITTVEGLKVLDISDYDNPITLGFYMTNDEIEDLKIYGSNILTISPAKFGVYQCDALSSVHTVSQIEPVSFALHSCYPNPFNPTTQISFDLPKSDHVSLKVFDILGREIATLVNGKMTAGSHMVLFDGTNLPSGVYLCRLQAGEFEQSRKLLLVK